MTVGWSKDIVQWRGGPVLYMSIPFTWQVYDARKIAQAHNGPVIAGGPGLTLTREGGEVLWAETPDSCPYDTLSMHNPLATFTTRGCIRKCRFCAVPFLEGEFRELKDWKPAPIVCDNNILASSMGHFMNVIEKLRRFNWVDFNQGLDARLLKPQHIRALATLRGVKLRFSMDSTRDEGPVKDAIDLAHVHGISGRDRISIYVLIGFNDSPGDARDRLELVRSWGHWPVPMRYQPLNAARKDDYVAEGWTNEELKRTVRYYSRLRYFSDIPFDEFGEQPDQMELIL